MSFASIGMGYNEVNGSVIATRGAKELVDETKIAIERLMFNFQIFTILGLHYII
jgi:hypothetical protein